MPENYTYDIACSGLAASGAVSSAISSITTGVCEAKINSKEWTAAITIAAGGLSGGITSTIAGGDFWDGVCNGLICAGLNHVMHLVAEGGSPDDPPGKTKQVKTRKENAENEGNAVSAGSITLIGGAAGQTVKTLNLDPKLSRLAKVSKWSNRIGLGGVALNTRNNFRQAKFGNISYTSAIIRSVVSGGEFVISAKIPVVGSIISIGITSYDIGGGFENNIYNVSDDWFYNLFNIDKPSSSQSHGYTGSW